MYFLTGTNTFEGSSDLDLRPPEVQRSTMEFWLDECENCTYINEDIEKDNGIDKEYLKSEEYVNCDGMIFKEELAKKFYRHFKIMMKLKNYEKAYQSLLNAVWVCDDADDVALTVKFRVWLDQIFGKLWKPDDEKMFVRHADVLRRSGSFDEVIKRYSDFLSAEQIHNDIIKFQLELSAKKDIRAYTVYDVQYNA
ncbi:MAG: hypothetical protein Q4G23_03300 [Clostridia bacterium]|nr:hypothetical protein [Clostridia bacterium]